MPKVSKEIKSEDTDEVLTSILQEIRNFRQEQEAILRRLDFQKQIFVQDGNKKKAIDLSKIAFITTNPKGLDIYTIDNKKWSNFASISVISQDLQNDTRFMKTHKSFIVNLEYIDTVEVDAGRVLTFKGLPPELTAKVSQDYVEEFEKRLGL